jgi:hypothetical protein
MSTARDLASVSGKTNRSFARWFLLIAVAIPFACGVLVSYSASTLFIIVLTVVPIWLLAAAAVFGFSAFNAVKKRWRISVYRLGSSVILAGSLILIPVGLDAGYHLRLWSFQNYYDGEIAKLSKDSNPPFRVFDWGGYFIFNSIFLVYDETDQLSLPLGTQSSKWKERVNGKTGGLFGGNWSAEHLKGHYYVVTTH